MTTTIIVIIDTLLVYYYDTKSVSKISYGNRD